MVRDTKRVCFTQHNKVDENANAANDSHLARHHLLLRILRSVQLVGTATETKVSA